MSLHQNFKSNFCIIVIFLVEIVIFLVEIVIFLFEIVIFLVEIVIFRVEIVILLNNLYNWIILELEIKNGVNLFGYCNNIKELNAETRIKYSDLLIQ